DVGPRLIGAAKMAERHNQRLVTVDEIRVGLDHAPAHDDGLLIVALESICYREGMLKQASIGIKRGQVEIAIELLEGDVRFANVAVRQSAQSPDERDIRVEAQRAIEVMNGRIEVLLQKRADMGTDSERLGVVGI